VTDYAKFLLIKQKLQEAAVHLEEAHEVAPASAAELDRLLDAAELALEKALDEALTRIVSCPGVPG